MLSRAGYVPADLPGISVFVNFSIHSVQAGGNAKSTAGSIKENVGGLVSDQWAAEGASTIVIS